MQILVAWVNKWQLRFNVSKCLVCFGRLHHYGNSIHGDLISPSDSVKDVGIFIDNKLKFHTQTASIIIKVIRTLIVIHKSFHFTSVNMFINLYKSLIRPIIKYGNIIWGPYYTLDQQSIEKIQRNYLQDYIILHILNNWPF